MIKIEIITTHFSYISKMQACDLTTVIRLDSNNSTKSVTFYSSIESSSASYPTWAQLLFQLKNGDTIEDLKLDEIEINGMMTQQLLVLPIWDNLVSFSMRKCSIAPDNLFLILFQVSRSSGLTTLNLDRMKLGVANLYALVQAMPTLQHLNLSHCHLSHVSTELSKILLRTTNLQSLNICNNKLNDSQVALILSSVPNITRLVIGNENELASETFSVLSTLSNLSHLDMDWSRINGWKVDLLIQTLKSLSKLECLDLSHNFMNGGMVGKIAAAICSEQIPIKQLHLNSSGYMTRKDWQEVAKIPTLEYLSVYDFDRNYEYPLGPLALIDCPKLKEAYFGPMSEAMKAVFINHGFELIANGIRRAITMQSETTPDGVIINLNIDPRLKNITINVTSF